MRLEVVGKSRVIERLGKGPYPAPNSAQVQTRIRIQYGVDVGHVTRSMRYRLRHEEVFGSRQADRNAGDRDSPATSNHLLLERKRREDEVDVGFRRRMPKEEDTGLPRESERVAQSWIEPSHVSSLEEFPPSATFQQNGNIDIVSCTGPAENRGGNPADDDVGDFHRSEEGPEVSEGSNQRGEWIRPRMPA